LDHTPLVVDTSIEEELVQEKYQTIIKNSEKKANFLSKLTKVIRNINTLYIMNKDSLKSIVQEYVRLSESI